MFTKSKTYWSRASEYIFWKIIKTMPLLSGHDVSLPTTWWMVVFFKVFDPLSFFFFSFIFFFITNNLAYILLFKTVTGFRRFMKSPSFITVGETNHANSICESHFSFLFVFLYNNIFYGLIKKAFGFNFDP